MRAGLPKSTWKVQKITLELQKPILIGEKQFGIVKTNLDNRKELWKCEKLIWTAEKHTGIAGNHFGIAGNHFVIAEKHSGLSKNFRHPHVFTYHGIF